MAGVRRAAAIESSDFEPCLCSEVKKISRLLGRIYDGALAGVGLTIMQYSVLRSIARRSGEPMSHIAEAMQMDRTTFYRAIAPMLRDGLVKSLAGGDARSRAVTMTAKGQRIFAQATEQWRIAQEQVQGAYGKTASAALLRELGKLAAAADHIEQ